MIKYLFGTLLLMAMGSNEVDAQQVSPRYLDLQKKIARGWNTWSYDNALTQVLLPEGLAMTINFRQSFIGATDDPVYFLKDVNLDKTRMLRPVAHTYDGSFTESVIDNWHGNQIRIQTAALGSDVVLLISPLKKSPDKKFNVELETGMMWNGKATLSRVGEKIIARVPTREYIIRSTKPSIKNFQPYKSPYMIFEGDTSIGIYTGAPKTLQQIEHIIDEAKKNYEKQSVKFGALAEAYKGIQSVLGWNTIYDPEKKRVITPVSRGWNKAWQGFVLFEWDTFFASLLFALDNKNLAYSNAIAVTKGINTLGHIGHWQMPGNKAAEGMSQPPVGSMICWKIYEKYQERWFLEEVYQELLTWNRWWVKNRLNEGYLAWGGWKGAAAQIAAWESGLDNAPMYEDIKMMSVGNNALQNLADVGLNSLYASDCQYLAKMACALGRKSEEKELLARSDQFATVTQHLWSEAEGIYLNKYVDSGSFSKRLSPTLFYPLIGNIASETQALRMLKEHYHNANEFNGRFIIPSCSRNDKSFDNQYWRGSIWPPLNFLVYLGLKNYDQATARQLAQQSFQLFIEAWVKDQCVYENINAEKGVTNRSDQLNCDPFYHWGALMGIMQFMEEGYYTTTK